MSAQSVQPLPGEPREVRIGQLLAILWRGRWLIASSVLLALALGLGFVIRRGTIWRASSRLQVENTAPGGATVESLLLAAGGKNYVHTQGEVLRSGKVLGAALQKDALRDNPIFDDVESRQAWLKKRLKVSVGRKDDIITVSLDSKLKEDACEIVNGVVDAYMDFHSSQNKSKAENIVDRLAARLDGLQAERESLSRERKSFIGANPDFSVHGQNLVMGNRLRELQTALLRDEDEEERARIAFDEGVNLAKDPERLREILQLRGGVGLNVVTTRIQSELRKQIWEVDNRRSVLLAQVTESHPSVRTLDMKIRGLEAQIEEIEQRNKALVDGYVASLGAAWKSTKETTRTRREKLVAAEKKYHGLELKRLEYDMLEDKWTTNSKLVAALTESVGRFTLSDLQIGAGNHPLNINIIDVASPRSVTVASSRAMTLAVFLLLGLLGGLGLAWSRAVFDTRLRTAEDVSEGLNLTLLGTMPRVSVGKDERAFVLWDDHETMAESARSLRTAVYFGLPKDEGRCVHITSPESGDGKSMIASNLAIAMAQAGQRTVLVDADLRRPKQAMLFALDAKPGLATVLASGQRVEELIQHTSIEKLDVLTSGPIPANPAEILNGDAFGELLEQLRSQYDRVIVDSPPVLPVADARIIATKCDVSLLVLRAEKSNRKQALAAHESIETVSARVLGVVFNDVQQRLGYGYGGRYGYSAYRSLSPNYSSPRCV